MLNDVDIYAPFRDDAEENAHQRPSKNNGVIGAVHVGLGFQTTLGFTYEVNISCKPSETNPRLPDAEDFLWKIRAFIQTFDIDREAKMMYQKMDGKVPLEQLRDVADEAYHVFTSIEPSKLLSFLRYGGAEFDVE